MNTQTELQTDDSINGYMLLFRGKDWDEGLSQEEIRQALERFTAWSGQLIKSGKVKGGQPLARKGAVIGRGGHVVSDGPFAETKEAVGGYLILDVATLEEAIKIAKSAPGLDYDIQIEVRPILAECPCFKRIRERLDLAPATDNLVTNLQAA